MSDQDELVLGYNPQPYHFDTTPAPPPPTKDFDAENLPTHQLQIFLALRDDKNDDDWDSACELIKADKNRKGPEVTVLVQFLHQISSNQSFLVHNYGSEDNSQPWTNDNNELEESQTFLPINKASNDRGILDAPHRTQIGF